ncbi:hypothetical protein ACFPTX_02060 [Pseudomonas sp. GCM10022188]|uniref:hypothetical protein n=1 Tax=Pseudomonas TaxID=286 RepID=UPI001E43582B|nr:hypothetical protein [Pseudomonas oryzagri]MCC6076493.1 hypothetical protein [Pseudomonas oryzagri]
MSLPDVVAPRSVNGIDTSLLYSELKAQFRRSGEPVEVSFRQLVKWVTLGDQFTHQLHPYPAKLLPHIANFFIRAKAARGDSGIVLDPFCGSGTVALEASLAGLVPLVADANPFALLLTKVKTHPYDVDGLRKELKLLALKCRRYRKAPEVDIINPQIWYKKEHKEKLDVIARAISEIDNLDQKDFFRLAFSVVAKKVSYSDPAVSVPVRLKQKESLSKEANARVQSRLDWIESLNVVNEFVSTCEQNIQRVAEANSFFPGRKQAIQVGDDVRNLSDNLLCKLKPSLILTSPPYGSAQKYVRASSLSLNWLGLAKPSDLSMLEGRSIGREHLPQWREKSGNSYELGGRYESILSKIRSVNPLRERITRQYLLDMQNAVVEMHNTLSADGHIVFVVGNNTVCGEVLCNDEFLIDACLAHGMKLELSLIDHIKSRGLMTKRNQTASVISREAVLVFKK